jgi:hypothetical protein
MVESDIVLRIYGPVSGGSTMQWDTVWRLYRLLGGLFPVTYDSEMS